MDNDDLLKLIFAGLNDGQTLLRSAITCKRWSDLSKGNELWEPVTTRRYHFVTKLHMGDPIVYKDIYARLEKNVQTMHEQTGLGTLN